MSKIVIDGSSRTGHDESSMLGSGDSGAAARHGGEWRWWSGGAAWWGVECGRDTVGSGDAARWGVETVEQQCSTVGSGVPTRCGGERRCDTVGSGDGGVRRESMGIGERSAVRVLAR
jgi:hypothetical protein